MRGGADAQRRGKSKRAEGRRRGCADAQQKQEDGGQ